MYNYIMSNYTYMLTQKIKHFMSTENIFDLPVGYQYGIGSAGF